MNPDKKASAMRHISIQNIRAESRSVIPSIIAGLESSPVEDIHLADIHVKVRIAVSADLLKTFPTEIMENVKGYPENRLTFGTKLPASGFFIRHAKGITLSNVSVTIPDDEARPSFVRDHAKDVELKNVRVNGQELRDEDKMVAKIASEAVSVIE